MTNEGLPLNKPQRNPLAAIMAADGTLTMSSLEIAERTEKRHDNVARDIRHMLKELHLEALSFEGYYTAENGKRNPCFHLPKDLTITLVAGYSIPLRKRIIDRWIELEAAAPPFDPEKALNDPVWLRHTLAGYTEKVLALEGKVEEMRPQVQALDRIAQSDGSFCITDAAKTLQLRPKDLFSFLRSHGWIYSRPNGVGEVAYQSKLAAGLLEHKTTTVSRSDGSEKTCTQVRVTTKGLTVLAREFESVARLI